MDTKLNELPPSQRQQYYVLAAEQAALSQESRHLEESIDELDRQLAVQEGELGRNPLKQRCVHVGCACTGVCVFGVKAWDGTGML